MVWTPSFRHGETLRQGEAWRYLRRPLRSKLGLLAFLLLFWTLSASVAQGGFNANTYYQQCLRFEAGGDLQTARQSCLNALSIRSEFDAATLALARIEIALGEYGAAERRLRGLPSGVEATLLLAEVALEEDRLGEAERQLRAAQSERVQSVSPELRAQRAYLSGQLAQARGRLEDALTQFEAAVDVAPSEARYRLALARLQLADRDAASAVQTLTRAAPKNAELLSLLAQAQWLAGDLAGAAKNFEAAVAARGALGGAATTRDLSHLTLVYYSQGDLQRGELTLRTAWRRGGLLEPLLEARMLWLAGLILLLALHLMGESRLEETSSLEPVERPEPWTVGQVYRTLFAALLSTFGLTLLYSYIRYQNLLAAFTPFQGPEMRAFFLAMLALLLAALSFWRVTVNGWRPLETLLGSASQVWGGALLGGALLGGVLGFQAYASQGDALTTWAVSSLSPSVPALVTALALPLAELFFRAFTIPPLERRYTPLYSVTISSLLYALVIGAPLALLLVIGAILSVGYWRTRSGFLTLSAQLTFNLGLLLSAGGWQSVLPF